MAAPHPRPNAQHSAAAQAAGLFETPLIVDQMPDCGPINAALRAAILKRREEHEGISISNVGGWHSDTEMLSWGGEAAQALNRRIVAAADQFTVDIRGGGTPRHRWASEMWANISPPGASNRHHCHPGAFWSAVYYVDDGYDGSTERELGGELVLFDPRMPMVRMTAPDLRFRRPGQNPEHDEVKLRPATGRIVIFPAWLSHAVLPYKGRSTRISIAVNLTPVALVARAPT